MKKLGKFLGIAAAILVLLLVVLAVLAKILVTPERVKQTVLPLAREALHREVRLGEIEGSLFSGVTLHDLVIPEREGEEPFVAADRMVLRYRLWPLLLGRVVVDEVRLESPRIRVVRLADGSFNFSDLLEKEGKGPERPLPAPPSPPEKGEGPAVDLLISEIAIDQGDLVFFDHFLQAEPPYRYQVTGLDVAARDLSLEKAFPFEAAARINGSPLEIQGEADLKALQGRAKVHLVDLDLTPFTPYFRDRIPGRLGSLKVSLDLEAEGGTEAVASNGRIEIKDIDLVLDAFEDAPLRGANASVDYKVKAEMARSVLIIEDAKAAFNGIPLQLSGRVENYAAAPAVDLTMELPELELRTAVKALPDGLVRPLEGFDPAGVIKARLSLAGAVAEPKKLLRSGEIHLAGVEANAGGVRPALNGSLKIEGDSVASEDLTMKMGDDQAAIALRAANLTGRPIVVAAKVSADRFALDPILKTAAAPAAGVQKGESPAPSPAAAAEIGPFDLPLKVDGTVQVKQTVYRGLTIEDFDLHCRLEKNVLSVDRLTGKAAGGSFDQTARIDLARKGLAYTTQLGIKGVQAEPLVAAFLPKAAGTVFGVLDLDAEMSGRGTRPETVKQNLSGKGDFLLADGKVTGAGLVQGLADFLNLEELRVLRFRQAKGSFTVAKGKVAVAADLSGSDVRLHPRGTVGLDGSLDMALDVRLSPDLTRKLDSRGKVSGYLADEQGWGQLPLKVAGSVGEPRFGLDTVALKKKAGEQVKKEVRKKIEEKVLEKLKPGEEGQPGAQEPARQLLEKSLKDLFGN